jgi:hypothetical protein
MLLPETWQLAMGGGMTLVLVIARRACPAWSSSVFVFMISWIASLCSQ